MVGAVGADVPHGEGAQEVREGRGVRGVGVVQLALGEAQLTSVERADALRLLPHALLGEEAGSVVALSIERRIEIL